MTSVVGRDHHVQAVVTIVNVVRERPGWALVDSEQDY